MSASASAGRLQEDLARLSDDEAAFVLSDWQIWARDDQLPPAAPDWRVWLILGGRGAGKTRAGAEWVRAKALGIPPLGEERARRIALVGETVADVRRVMIDGVSGLLAVHGKDERPELEISKLQLVWPGGTIAQMFSAEDPDSLRGPQFDAAWCDELAKWRRAEETWDMLQFGLRLGAKPQVAITTTPRPLPLLKSLIVDAGTAVTRAATSANAARPSLRKWNGATPARPSADRSCSARSSTSGRARSGGATGSRPTAWPRAPISRMSLSPSIRR